MGRPAKVYRKRPALPVRLFKPIWRVDRARAMREDQNNVFWEIVYKSATRKLLGA